MHLVPCSLEFLVVHLTFNLPTLACGIDSLCGQFVTSLILVHVHVRYLPETQCEKKEDTERYVACEDKLLKTEYSLIVSTCHVR